MYESFPPKVFCLHIKNLLFDTLIEIASFDRPFLSGTFYDKNGKCKTKCDLLNIKVSSNLTIIFSGERQA